MAFLDSDISPDSILLIVARHGSTVLNARNAFRGSSNPPLDEQGTEDANNLADLLENVEISHIVTSDRARARQTADIIGKRKHQPVHSTENLRALDVGNLSGQKRTKANIDLLQRYLDNPDELIPGGESLNDFKARIQPCLSEAADVAIESGAPVLLIAHSSIVHEVGAWLTGDHSSVLVKPGGVAVMYVNDRGQPAAAPVYRVDHERIRSAETLS